MNKYKSYLIPALIAAIVGVGLVYYTTHKDLKVDNNVQISNYQDCIDAGNPSMESYPSQCKTQDGKSFTEDIGNENEVSADIKSSNPRPNQTISSPLTITGQAKGNWFFEASFPASLIDANGKVIATFPLTAQGEWMTTNFVNYKGEIKFNTPQTATGTLILKNSNASGLPENDKELKIPVKFADYKNDSETTSIKNFYSNSKLNAQCENTVPLTREVPESATVGTAAINALLKGPTADEKAKGYATLINEGTKLNKLTIEDGIARADFSSELNQGVSGSCRVRAIRSQITNTLKQFPTVKEVIISVNGNSDTILQP